MSLRGLGVLACNIRLQKNQNKEVMIKVVELTLEIRSVASSLDECKNIIQTDRQVYQSLICKLNSEIGNLRSNLIVIRPISCLQLSADQYNN